MKTLKEVNMVLDLLNSLTDSLKEPRIPVKYFFNHEYEDWEIHNIYAEDKKRFENCLEVVFNVDLYDYKWEA